MENKDSVIEKLKKEVLLLKSEIERLQNILTNAGIYFEKHETGFTLPEETPDSKSNDTGVPQLISNAINVQQLMDISQGQRIIPEQITEQHARYFYSFFKGRNDVYSKRSGKKNEKTGKTGYYTQCFNYWKDEICPKKDRKKVKCYECSNQSYKKLTVQILMHHLKGEREDCSDVIGIYPLLNDETCNFLVFDFDNHSEESKEDDFVNTDDVWREEVSALRVICQINKVSILIERSRSGKGAHIWMFFEEPIPASLARRFGAALLTKGAESVNQISFKTYDRMLPSQDHQPAGGLGNLIALPLQGQALRNGNSAFINEEWIAYPNQWKELQDIKRLPKTFIEEKIKEWSAEGILGAMSEDMSGNNDEQKDTEKVKPWEKKKKQFRPDDVQGCIKITLADRIYILTKNIKPRMQNQVRRLAAYNNPEFYKNQAMGFSTQGYPRIIGCSEDYKEYIAIPRGCKESFINRLNEAGILYADWSSKVSIHCKR